MVVGKVWRVRRFGELAEEIWKEKVRRFGIWKVEVRKVGKVVKGERVWRMLAPSSASSHPPVKTSSA